MRNVGVKGLVSFREEKEAGPPTEGMGATATAVGALTAGVEAGIDGAVEAELALGCTVEGVGVFCELEVEDAVPAEPPLGFPVETATPLDLHPDSANPSPHQKLV
ncbi:hypothetical protein [Funiculus sociatus]|uniref:hypothetical protein n=1 Tax=Funiculus sociatus TaxID=450527 RepID=UPI003298A0A7